MKFGNAVEEYFDRKILLGLQQDRQMLWGSTQIGHIVGSCCRESMCEVRLPKPCPFHRKVREVQLAAGGRQVAPTFPLIGAHSNLAHSNLAGVGGEGGWAESV